ACRATRGVVMALARFESTNRMHFVSAGNIEARAWLKPHPLRFIGPRGIIGVHQLKVSVEEHEWTPEGILVLHSDGLGSKWNWSDFPGLELEPAQVIASKLMRALGRESDDATIVVARNDKFAPAIKAR